jgi:hypothetical protein
LAAAAGVLVPLEQQRLRQLPKEMGVTELHRLFLEFLLLTQVEAAAVQEVLQAHRAQLPAVLEVLAEAVLVEVDQL